jgi:hypothetical protein
MARMTAPRSGVKVRMYRQGHGDCFLLAFAGREGRKKRTVYVLIDCGLKPKSEVKRQPIARIIDDIHEATGGHIDIVVVTHEHQDHVNGFSKKESTRRLFDRLTFERLWLAWTEDGTDELANELRTRFDDTLVTLALAQERAARLGVDAGLVERLSDLIGLEVGDDGAAVEPGREGAAVVEAFRAAAASVPLGDAAAINLAGVKGITNKKAIADLRKQASGSVTFLGPHLPPEELPGVEGGAVYALGPPRNVGLLLDLDPKGAEEFHFGLGRDPLMLDGSARSFAEALAPDSRKSERSHPFSKRFRISEEDALGDEGHRKDGTPEGPAQPALDYFRRVYGGPGPDDEMAWRRIDQEWLGAAEGLALRLNKEVNNTSLVLAFKLPKSGKVLLFTGDAQRGNWLGWSDLEWQDSTGERMTARDLLGRTVFYKVGHHGSHNATLNGAQSDDHANLSWMGRGAYAEEFTAVIPANTTWALGKSKPWVHPQPEIEKALMAKAKGRVFRTDRDHVERPVDGTLSEEGWNAFQARTHEEDLFFEYVIEDR